MRNWMLAPKTICLGAANGTFDGIHVEPSFFCLGHRGSRPVRVSRISEFGSSIGSPTGSKTPTPICRGRLKREQWGSAAWPGRAVLGPTSSLNQHEKGLSSQKCVKVATPICRGR